MLTLRKLLPETGIALTDVLLPTIGVDEVLVAVAAAGICGSDLHIADWTRSYAFIAPALPVTLGHEFAGTVVAVGHGAADASVGDRVVVMPSVTCGRCDGCRIDGPDACSRRKGLGMARNGGFAPYVAVPAINCVKLPADLSFDLAALTEPLTVSAEAVARGEVAPGSRVLVMGPGTIGQGVAILARRAGAASVTVTGFDDGARLEVLRRLGFDSLVDMAMPDATERLCQVANDGFDVIIEATGAASAVSQGLALLRTGGTLVISGIHDQPVEIDATAMVRRNLQVRGSYRSPRAAWPRIVAMLASDQGAFAPMITHRRSLEEAFDAFALAKNKRASKVMLKPTIDMPL